MSDESAVIRMLSFDPCILTTEEYEQLEREVMGRILAADSGISDRICARLLVEHRYRYIEAKKINGNTGAK